MKPPKKRDKILLTRAGASCPETVAQIFNDPGLGAWKLEITSSGQYKVGELYTIQDHAGRASHLIVGKVRPIPNRDSFRVLFHTVAIPHRVA